MDLLTEIDVIHKLYFMRRLLTLTDSRIYRRGLSQRMHEMRH